MTGANRSWRNWPLQVGLALMRFLARWPYAWLARIGAGLGWLLLRIGGERRRIADTNLQLCFPEWSAEQRQQVLRECFRTMGIAMLELAPLWFGAWSRIEKVAEVRGLELLRQARADGRGVIVLGFHFNDLELGGTALAHQVDQFACMYRPHANPVFEQAMRSGRLRHLQVIERDDVRATVRWLKAGGVLWYAADQDYGARHSIFAPFFGIPTASIVALTRFAKMSGAAVVPMTHQRTASGLLVQLHAPLNIPGADDYADASCVNAFLEQHLRQFPANYMWTHRRFKTRPEGMPAFYEKRKRRYAEHEISGKRLQDLLAGATPLAVCPGWQQTRNADLVYLWPLPFWYWRKRPQQAHQRIAEQLRHVLQGQSGIVVVLQNCRHRHVDVLQLKGVTMNAAPQLMEQLQRMAVDKSR